jgi:VanZ like family/Concanavalin A-like lectin/glucanases superfamily
VLVTITFSRTGTSVYADGALLRKFTDFRLSRQDLTGRLVVGNSPVVANNWSGRFRGLAIYDRELTADEVSRNFSEWTQSEQLDVVRNEGPAALYRFNEGSGDVIHDQVKSATDLIIPERFFVLHEQFLERPWDEYRAGWHYGKNVGINIAGFIPLGFFFCAYFSSLRNSNGAVAKTIALGFTVSLTIEVLQAFLPTRDSGMTDLVTNTLGTALGVMVFRYNSFQRPWHRWDFALKSRTSPLLLSLAPLDGRRTGGRVG